MSRKYKLAISGVIHVGGHYGEEIPDYIKLNIKNIYLFEPLKENFEILQKQVLKHNVDSNVQSYCYALGAEDREQKIYLSSNNLESSSLLQPDQHLIDHPTVKFDGERNIKVKKLDQFKIFNSNFLNMDVQGFELEVLKGSLETLKKIDYIYCEVNRASTYKNNPLVNDLDIFLEEYNFIRCETVWAGKKLSWGDAFYVRKDKLSINKRYSFLYLFIKLFYKFKNKFKNLIKKIFIS